MTLMRNIYLPSTMFRKNNQKANSLRANRGGTRKSSQQTRMESPSRQDNALILRPEYQGQPVTVLKIPCSPILLSTIVTTGVIAQLTTLYAGLVPNFAARFLAFEQFRIVKAKAKISNFSVTNPGFINQWFDSDNSGTPTTSQAENSLARRFAASRPGPHVLDYVPHDPAEQGWSLVSAASGIIGYHKVYTDNANYGSSIVATPYSLLDLELTIQFRGFV